MLCSALLFTCQSYSMGSWFLGPNESKLQEMREERERKKESEIKTALEGMTTEAKAKDRYEGEYLNVLDGANFSVQIKKENATSKIQYELSCVQPMVEKRVQDIISKLPQ